jgi:small conductance mechanosensitive channel
MLVSSLLAVVLFISPAAAMGAEAPPASNPQAATSAATQPVAPAPTTQQSEVAAAAAAAAVAAVEARDGEDASIGQAFRNTRVGQLFEGKTKVTLEDVRNPVFWIDTVRDLIVAVISFIPRILVAIAFLFFFWLIYRAARRLVIGSMSKAAVDPSIRDMLGFLIKWSIMGFGLVIAFNQIGVQIAALLTGVSIIGLAVGFAAQETLANFIAGIVIFWDKPFKVGDWIEIDGALGQVKRVTFRSTRLSNLDNDMVVIPNTVVLSQKFTNKTTNQITRASVPIGIAYKESIDKAREVLLGTTRNDKRIVSQPPPLVEVRACGASSVDLMLHFWIKEEAYEDAMIWEYLEKSKKALDAAGIEIPFPHMQLLVEETPAIAALSGRMRPAG